MKKTFALIVVLLLCIGFTSYAESDSLATILTSDTWEKLNGTGYFQFFPDGSGNSFGKYPTTWEVLSDNEVEINIVEFDKINVYVFSAEDGIPTLTKAADPDTKYISGRFVPDKNGDSVEITYEDGTVETTTGKGICIAYSGNELLGSKYRGSDVVVIGQVKKIHGPTNYNGYMMTEGYLELVGPWIVEIPHGCGELAMSLKVGDFVKVPGYISSISTFSTYYTTMDSILVHQQFDEESQSIVPMELYIPEEAE